MDKLWINEHQAIIEQNHITVPKCPKCNSPMASVMFGGNAVFKCINNNCNKNLIKDDAHEII